MLYIIISIDSSYTIIKIPLMLLCIASYYTIMIAGCFIGNDINEDIITNFVGNGQTSRGLYVNYTSLYLLPDPVPAMGSVRKISFYGYTAAEYEQKVLEQPMTIWPFLYVLLFRPQDEAGTTYTMAYNPTVVFHATEVGCVGPNEGLEWEVEEGDRVGIFIPNNCTQTDHLMQQSNIDMTNDMYLMEIDLLCPMHINLVDDSISALYLESSEMVTVNEITAIKLDEFNMVSTRLNMEMEVSITVGEKSM